MDEAFSFLRERFGFSEPEVEVEVNPTGQGGPPTIHPSAPMDGRVSAVVQVVGPRASVRVAHDPRGEVLVSVVDHSTGRAFPLTHIVQFGGASSTDYRPMYSGGFDGLVRALRRVASAMEQHGGPWLQGHPEAVSSLGDFLDVVSALSTARYAADRRDGTLPDRLLKACSAKDFAELVRLLESIPGPLTEVEQQALSYGKEQLQLEGGT